MTKKSIRYFFPVLLALFISTPLIIPYFHSGYFPTHDGEWAVVRLADMFRSLRDGQFPVRYSGNLNFGYGYPLFNFAYPFPYYFGMFFYLLGFGFVGSVKAMFVSATIVSVLGMYIAVSKFWNNRLAGITGAVLYAYLPYRLVDLFVRGSIGETIALALVPLIIYILLKINPEKRCDLYSLAMAILYSALIGSHNIMALLFTPVLLLFILLLWFKNKDYFNFKNYIFPFLLGLGLSAFFWLPAIYEKKYILLSKIPIADRSLYFVSLKGLLIPKWGYAPPTNIDGFSYNLGIPHLLVFFASPAILIFLYLKGKKNLNLIGNVFIKQILSILLFSLGAFFLLFKFSGFIWENIPLLSEINYPWTLLAVLGFLTSFLSGFLVKIAKNKNRLLVAGGLILLSVVLYLPNAKPEKYINRTDEFYLTNDATTTSSQELMPLWVEDFPKKRPEKLVNVEDYEKKIKKLKNTSTHISFKINLENGQKIRLNKIYYPGWKAWINGRKVKINYDNPQGLMEISVPGGENNIEFKFTETPLRLVGDIVSLFSVIFLIVKKWVL